MFQAPVSRLATASVLLAACGAAAAALAGPLYRIHTVELDSALMMIAAGFVAGALALIPGGVGLVATFGLHGKRGRGRALAGLALGLGVVVVAGPKVYGAVLGPNLHDLVTTEDDPPSFRALAPARERAGSAVDYPGGAVAERQAEAHPELTGRDYPHDVSEILSAAESAALGLEWTVARTDMQGELEATARSYWLGIVHDIVIRVEDDGDHRRVDARAATRGGEADVGDNARLVSDFYEELEAQLER
ncbi:DUF1499 domain-containing protein [Halorhodospira halophila]|uniref:DUF1499 domain-containing protein n=1 Tax=Halorhodospira halophila (strain DSM 244 / SL1) TaxID=349124 RepID=A1WZA0_HALHL|nr:DUF1499 domain-containing protein [Halorhodospira halophila]ABM63012.1 conserved hypothetical protein [Halorhodospira halophila SL1]MBK1727867.1 DUF1499 domain-containing protein [Halorhodospira halophila]